MITCDHRIFFFVDCVSNNTRNNYFSHGSCCCMIQRAVTTTFRGSPPRTLLSWILGLLPREHHSNSQALRAFLKQIDSGEEVLWECFRIGPRAHKKPCFRMAILSIISSTIHKTAGHLSNKPTTILSTTAENVLFAPDAQTRPEAQQTLTYRIQAGNVDARRYSKDLRNCMSSFMQWFWKLLSRSLHKSVHTYIA